MPATTTCDGDTLILALATLGGVTEIEMILYVTSPKVVKASTVTCGHRHKRIHIRFLCVSLSPTVLLMNIANVNDPLTHSQQSKWYILRMPSLV